MGGLRECYTSLVQNRISEAEFISLENGVISLKRVEDVLTVVNNPRGAGVPIQRKVGPGFVPIDPAEIKPGSILMVTTTVGK